MTTLYPPESQEGKSESETRPRKRTTFRSEKARANKANVIRDAGRMLPLAPTDPSDIAGIWEIGSEEAHGIMLKILRQPKGMDERGTELVAAVPLVDYSLLDLAGRYGPGIYWIRGSGKYAQRVCKLTVSDDLARDGGFGRIVEPPKPTAGDVMAMQTVRRLELGDPVNGVELLAAIERIVEAKVSKLAPEPAAQAPKSIEDQFGSFMAMMKLTDQLEERALRTVERRMGVATAPEDKPLTTADILLQLAPKALEIFGAMVNSRQQPPMRAQAAPGAPRVVNPPQPPAQAPAVPTEAHPGAPMQIILTPSEQQTLNLAASMLKPMAGALGQLLNRPESDSDLADELGAYIPPALHDPMCDLSKLVDAKGAGVLGMIHPSLQADRFVRILAEIRRKIESAGDE